MIAISRLVFFVIVIFVIFPLFSFAETNLHFPDWWGALSSDRIDAAECPDLNGKFVNEGNGYEIFDGKATSASQNGNEVSYANAIFDFTKKQIRQKLTPDLKVDTLLLMQDKYSLNIIVPSWDDKNTEEIYHFKVGLSDYVCSEGWLKFRVELSTVGSEWGTQRFKALVRVSKLQDGSLLVYQNQEIKNYRLFFGFGNVVHRELFAKFQASK